MGFRRGGSANCAEPAVLELYSRTVQLSATIRTPARSDETGPASTKPESSSAPTVWLLRFDRERSPHGGRRRGQSFTRRGAFVEAGRRNLPDPQRVKSTAARVS